MESYVERFTREQKEKENRSGEIPSQKGKKQKVSRKDGENDGQNTGAERHEAQKESGTGEQTK